MEISARRGTRFASPFGAHARERPGLRVIVLLVTHALVLSFQSVWSIHAWLRPDFTTLFVLYVALEFDLVPGALLAFCLSYFSDVLSGDPAGLHLASSVLVFFGFRLAIARMERTTATSVVVLGVAGVLIKLVCVFLLESWLGPNEKRVSAVFSSLASVVISACVLSYPLYRLLGRIDRRFRERAPLGLS